MFASLKSIFSESNGTTLSSRRILFAASTGACLGAAGYALFTHQDVQPGVVTLLQFVVGTTGAAAGIGRFAENKAGA